MSRITTKAIKRSTTLGIIILIGFAVLLLRILYIQTIKFEEYQEKVLSQITTETKIPANRGKIYDRNGNVLATTTDTYRVFISPSGIKKAMTAKEAGDETDYVELVTNGLVETLGVDRNFVLKQINEFSDKLDRTIERKVSKETAEKLRKYIAEHKLQTMIYLEEQDTRYYPYGDLASHVLGFTNSDGEGLYGIEYQYNDKLAGVDGYYITARDSYGDEMPFDYATQVAPIDGYNVKSTLDITIQSFLEEQLEATVIKHQAANRASGIVMNVKTGAILAMATTGSFDLNDPWQLDSISQTMLEKSGYDQGSEDYANYQAALLTQMWSNKAVTESYIPGSTFKIITSAMAIEENEGDIPSSVNCIGYLRESTTGQKIKCHETEGHGSLTFAEGLQHSCNVWFMTLGDLVGVETFNKYVKAFGYLEKTGVDLPGEASGIFRSDMSHLDLVIYAFGQNFNVTPLQQLTAISAVANGGDLVTPYIVEQISDDAGNVIYQHENEIKRQVVSEEVCEKISKILEEGVSGNGGAKNARVDGYLVAAKTGTSEKKEIGHTVIAVENYMKYKPENSKKEIPYTVLEAKKKIEESGLKCVVVGNYSDDTIVVAQTPDPKSSMVKEGGIITLYASESASSVVKVPSVEGKTLTEAKILLAEAGLNFNIENTAIHAEILEQSIGAGEYVEKGSVIKLRFREGYVCSTVAYAPADDPEIAIIILVDEPIKGSLYGSTVAAPYVSKTLEQTLPYLGIKKSTEN